MLEPVFESDRQQVLAELRRRISGSSVLAGSPLAGAAALTTLTSPAAVPAVPTVPTAPAAVAAASSVTATAGSGSVLTVPGPLAEVLPRGGIPAGSVVGLTGSGGTTSLLFTLLAAPPNAWSALVGMPDVGLLAAAELGVELDRVALIPDPGPDLLQVLSILADGVDIIAVAPARSATGIGATPARMRVLTSRLRQSGAVLLVAGGMPGADLVLDCRVEGWTGMGRGHGRLRNRELVVQVSGRGAAGRSRSAVLYLQSDRSKIDISAGRVSDLEQSVADVG
jgi:hypothetical protein